MQRSNTEEKCKTIWGAQHSDLLGGPCHNQAGRTLAQIALGLLRHLEEEQVEERALKKYIYLNIKI